ncbi:Uncharacterized protein GBIM_16619 [Gryllus bimaculatus]|nr:Uncharacterized protein GBIM_16619 [Gryllus bimaculatus]
MEDPENLGECIVKVENEVKQEPGSDSLDSSGLNDITSQTQVIVGNIKREEASDEEELERPAQVTVEDYKEEVQEGFYTSILPTVSSAQTSVSLSRPQASVQLQWKDQSQLPAHISSTEPQQWVDDKGGVLTIAAPNVGAQWIAADAQNFTDRDGNLVKDAGNVQYVLMTSADQFYLVESGDNNTICASDGSIKNIVAGDKNIQMISIVPNQSLANSGVVIGNIVGEQDVVQVATKEGDNMVTPAGTSSKRSSDSVPVLTTIASEDLELKQTEISRKKKKVEKRNASTTDHESGVKKPCDLNSCPLRCTAVFDEDERNEIFRAFQSLSPEDQKKFVMQCCSRKIYLKDVKGYDGSSKTTSHFKYDFQMRSAKGVPVQVCKVFFASTLGFTDFYFSCYLSDLFKNPNTSKLCQSSGSSQCSCSGSSARQRGKATGKWAANCKVHSDVYSHVNRDLFHRHIESFLRTLCIPQGEHMRTINYLPKEVSIQMMHEDFVLKHPEINCSYELYKNFVVLFTS